jgi:hypothetical protein
MLQAMKRRSNIENILREVFNDLFRNWLHPTLS